MSHGPRVPPTGLFIVALIAAGTTSARAAPPATIPSFQVSGRVALSEPHSCDGGGGDLTKNVLLGWAECHALKQHMDAAGTPITTSVFEPTALRPLTLTVAVEVWCVYAGGRYEDPLPMTTVRLQTDSVGRYQGTIPTTTCGRSSSPESVAVRTSALLQVEMLEGTAVVGTIRGIWDKTLGQTAYTSFRTAVEPVLFSSDGHDWVIPRFEMLTSVRRLPVRGTVDLGTHTFFGGAGPTAYDYLRGALGAWQTLVALHTRLQSTLSADGFGSEYARMFITRPSWMCASCYTLFYENPGSGGFGGAGTLSLDQPVASPSYPIYGGLVSVGLPAHELGHSMHEAIATGSFTSSDDTMFVTLSPQGVIGGYHAPYVSSGTLQQQEMVMAFVEGFGYAMATYTLSGCKVADRGWGDPDPQTAMWNAAAFTSCDGLDPYCPYSAFRLQMNARGIAEGSAPWNTRLAALSDLAKAAQAAGAINVITNNELKVRGFFCDLLDDEPDVAFASNATAGQIYVSDLAWQAAERLDGRTPPLVFKKYAADPQPERVRISLGELLAAMDTLVPNIGTLTFPQPLYMAPIVDGANGPYNDARMSVESPFSPQALGMVLVNRGDLTLAELNDILRANRMDEAP